jgi:hypothetical protein
MKRSLTLACMLALLTVAAYSQTVTLDDSSDWWSINRDDPGRPSAKTSNHELQASNFEIAGITLGRGGSDAITTKLGMATSIERGDASTGRSQLCYSSGHAGSEHLVFEFGEDESVVYLFSGGKPWNGEKYCVLSKKPLNALTTASGLRLGLSRLEVEKTLGRPDGESPNSVVYSRQFEQKSTPQEFAVLRRDYPQNLSDEEAHKKFDYYPVEQYVLARFANSKLVYLAISISGEGD